ncbi:hypothetical protein [Helicobacter cappadocius]|uniref:Outer membrane protein beta-barrel domain-containing protein n=1 Tax=Helicobacter cappadocius TaxID=3063998 RepID=A0AA90PRN4_9HELI|nr:MULTISPECIES: hypothetical protein [unclassified Helicobacter]MDO7253062.1 hypothetical protein [Helicobacter sp. faydin-H75]MDP2538812.1 hypothetical protein [Helicobacter sp. faydin-H76]
MKIMMSALVATALLGSIAIADEIDDQIQRLEKENKLLELQKKKKELEKQNQMVNKNNTDGNNSLTIDSKSGKTKNPNSKNGGFIGVEGVLGGDTINDTYYIQDTCDGRTQCSSTILFTASNTTFDLGLVGGYQHYFGSSQRHGIKVSAHLYSGFGNSWQLSAVDPLFGDNVTGSISYIPIKFGFDVKYLWDFMQRGKHTLGLNVGLGYEFDAYVNGKSTVSNYDDEKLDSIFLNSFYPVIGLHYYYGHHQFELMYRFGGIFSELGSKQVYYDSEPITAVLSDASLTSVTSYKISLLNQSYLTINYAYRF